MSERDEIQCDFCGEWIEEELAEDAEWALNYFFDAKHDLNVNAPVCYNCKKQFLEQGDDGEWHYRTD